jgi:hypothetical protein
MAAAAREERPGGPVDMPKKVADDITNGGHKQQPPSRLNTTTIGGHFPTPISLALYVLLARLGAERGRRISVQHALTEMLVDYFVKNRERLPDALVQTAAAVGIEIPPDPGPTKPHKQKHLKSVTPSGVN